MSSITDIRVTPSFLLTNVECEMLVSDFIFNDYKVTCCINVVHECSQHH